MQEHRSRKDRVESLERMLAPQFVKGAELQVI